MLKDKMNSMVISEMIENDINSFLTDINLILEQKEKESNLKNITDEIEKEDGCLNQYFSIGYKKFSETINKYNIFWIPTLKRFCYCSLTAPTEIKTEEIKTEQKENNNNLLVKGKTYNDIKQHSLRFDSDLKNRLEKIYNEYSYLDRTYINSRVIEIGLDNIK